MAWRVCLLAILVFSCARAASDEDPKDLDPCTTEGDTRLDGITANETCGSMEGRVQVCEDLVWRFLCDSNWTVQDAAVTCRSLNYSTNRASNIQNNQVSVESSSYAVVCNGPEDSLANCAQIDSMVTGDDRVCPVAVFVKCFVSDEKAELNSDCLEEEDTAVPTEVSSTPPISATSRSTVVNTPGSNSPPLTDTEPSMADTTTRPSLPSLTHPSTNLLTAPNLYIIIGATLAISATLLLLIAIVVLACCCRYKRRKGVSPTDAGQQEKDNGQLQNVDYGTESKSKDHSATHHQLSQQPIYEAITSTAENSSTHSQESPSLKPLKPVSTDLYASLDQSNTYAQIEPHISSPRSGSATISSPNAESYYQQLDHRTGSRMGSMTGSMKRELPSRPMEAINLTALAVARGEVKEGDLSTQGEVLVGGSSTSLPNTGYANHHHQQVPNGRHLEDVQLKEMLENGTQSGGTNIYNILDPPPPDYNTLEQIDEISLVSTVAVCNNGNARGGHGTKSKEHSPHSSHHSMERFHIESSSHSPRSSRTSSLSSNSPQTNRTSRSPQVGRPGGPLNRKISANRYSDDPTASKSGSPLITNRHSGQSAGSDTMIDTLV